jgi:WD40 repeat protein
VWIWDALDEYECIAVLQHHTQDVKCVVFSPSGLFLASGSYDDHVNLYRCDDEEWIIMARWKVDSTVWQIAYGGNDDSVICVACDDGSISFYNVGGLEDGQVPVLIQKLVLGDQLMSCSWSKIGGEFIVACGQECIYLVKKNGGEWECVDTVFGHQGRDVNCVEVSPWEKGVFSSCGDDQHVRVWKV